MPYQFTMNIPKIGPCLCIGREQASRNKAENKKMPGSDTTGTARFHQWVMESPTEPPSVPKSMAKHAPPTLKQYLIRKCKEELQQQYEEEEEEDESTFQYRQPLDPKPYLGRREIANRAPRP